ncbi:hypothetical protein Tco_0689280 [Tanacetum coccineum]
MLANYNANVPVEFKAPKTSSPAERKVFEGKNLGASSGLKRKQFSKHIFESKIETSKSKTGHLDKENMSSSALDNNLSHASASTPVVDELHKEDQQAAGGPTSLGVTSEKGADSQLSRTNRSVLVDTTKFAGDRLKTTHTESGTNKDKRSDFMDTDSKEDEPIIITDGSNEEETERYEDTHATPHDEPEDISVPHPPSPRSVTVTLSRFTSIVEHASQKAKNKSVPSAGQTSASPAEREKKTNLATKDVETTNLKDELIDLMGIDVVAKYHKNKLLYDEYYDIMLKRRKSSKTTNCDVLTKKGPITLKVYREDGTDEVISNFKTRIDYLTQTKEELKIDFNKPLKEQDPLDELNDLANKKRKRAGDLSNNSRSTKKFKSSVQHEDEGH